MLSPNFPSCSSSQRRHLRREQMARLTFFNHSFLTHFGASLLADISGGTWYDRTLSPIITDVLCLSVRQGSSIWTLTSPLSILHFINVALRDLVQLRRDETTLADDWPFHRSLFCVLFVHWNVDVGDKPTSWPSFFSCMVICDMTVNMKRLMGEPIKHVHITLLPFTSGNPSVYFLCETFTSTFVPAFSQLRNGSPFTQGAGDGAFSLAYRAHTHTPLHKCSPSRYPPQFSLPLKCVSPALSLRRV